MRLAPHPSNPKLPPDKLPLYECSDCIVLPKSVSEALLFERHDLVTISNAANQTMTGTLFETQEEAETTIYVPSWMFFRFDDVNGVTLYHAPKRRCTSLQIRPHSAELSRRSDFNELLNHAVLRYHSLTQGTKIPLFINNAIEFVTIVNMLPPKHTTYYVYNCGTIDLTLLPPKLPAAVQTKAPIPFLYSSPPSETIYPYAFMGRGFVLSGNTSTPPIDPGEAAAAAARKRLLKK